MAISTPPFTPPVQPAFRVGITGTRALAATALAPLEARITEVLDRIAAALPDHALRRAISPLAEGADRLLAEAALARGWQLAAPLPFEQAEYETDFPASVPAFRALLARATPLTLDGSRDHAPASYEAAGRFVVRNCDLLIAIWDGHTNNGRGGTAETMRFAAHAEVPIWWLMPDGTTPPRLIRRTADLAHPPLAPSGPDAEGALRAMIARLVTPPDAPPPDRAGSIGHMVATGCRLAGVPDDPLSDYLNETSRPDRLIWRLYAGLMAHIAPPPRQDAAPARQLDDNAVARYWTRTHEPADRLSSAYGERYRSCYLWVFLLAALAVTSAVLGFAFPETLERGMAPAEAVFLIGIVGVVSCNHLRRFHERWISYRLLAELCRKQKVLARLGWSLPHWQVERLTRDEAGGTEGAPRETWVAWYFSAACRAAPLPGGVLEQADIEQALEGGRKLAAEQIAYHHAREQRSETAGQWLGAAGEWAFTATLALVAVKLLMVFEVAGLPAADGLAGRLVGVGCLVMPAISAAFVGIRAYAEFEVLAQQSARMSREIAEIAEALNHDAAGEPLASQRVAARLMELAMAMLRELRGWAQLFRVKPVDGAMPA